jgi:1-acyl-sn-glycerol-3-phosphate acyltransferase
MKRFLRRIHYYLGGLSLLFFLLVLYPFLYFFSRKPSRYLNLNRVRKIYGMLSSGLVGIFYRVQFEQMIDWSKPYILCPNHSSNLDITAIAMLMPFSVTYAFLGKEELLKNPVTAIFFRSVDIPLKRESKLSSFRAFKRAGEYLQKGISVIIFPEGKIPGHFPPKLEPFKNGPFRLAIEQQVQIIPVSIRDAWKKGWDDGKVYGTRPGICDIWVHAPVNTAGMTVDDADALRDRIFNMMNTEQAKSR